MQIKDIKDNYTRDLALFYTKKDREKWGHCTKIDTLMDLYLDNGFDWTKTEQGGIFWGKVSRGECTTPYIKTDGSHRDTNVGNSNYSDFKIQVWDIWKEYNLNAFDADIVKRVLRTKEGDSRIMDYKKIIHICQERINQLEQE